MRDRLIEMIKDAEKAFPKDKPVLDIEEFVADYLLANGVMMPQFAVGDTVWCLQKEDGKYAGLIGEMFLAVVGDAVITTAFMYDFANDAEEAVEYYIKNTQDELSSDVEFYPLCDCFASREEAVQALAERSANDS